MGRSWLAAVGLSVLAHAGTLTAVAGLGLVEPVSRESAPPRAVLVRTVIDKPPEVEPVAAAPLVEEAGSRSAPVASTAVRDAESKRTSEGLVDGNGRGDFLPSRVLDAPPLVRSSPDISALSGTVSSGLPIRMRLFVDDRGQVVDIRVLQATELDAAAVERLKQMFFETSFLPGKREGADVSSFLDIELQISESR